MIAVVVTTVLLVLGALLAGAGLTWRRHALQPVPVTCRIVGPTCTPRVRR